MERSRGWARRGRVAWQNWEEDGGFLPPCFGKENPFLHSLSTSCVPKTPGFRVWSLVSACSHIVFHRSFPLGTGAGNSPPSSSSPQEVKTWPRGVQVCLPPPGQTKTRQAASECLLPSRQSGCSLFCLLNPSEMPPGGEIWLSAEIIWWGTVLGRSRGKAEMLWGMPVSPPVPRFPVSPWGRPGDPGSIPVSGEAEGAPPGLPDAGTGELSRRWVAFQVSSDKLPKKAGAWRKNRKSPNPNKRGRKKKKNLVFGFWSKMLKTLRMPQGC